METENLQILSQLIESMRSAAEKLEKASEKGNVEKFKKISEEIMKFQRQVDGLLK